MSTTESIDIGIDLGTTNSVVAYSEDGRTSRVLGKKDHHGLFPSVLSQGTAGLLVGRPAMNNRLVAPESTILCVKRLMGRDYSEGVAEEARERYDFGLRQSENGGIVLSVGSRLMSPSEVSAQFLSALKKRAEAELKRKVRGAVITVPAYFEERQRAATREAGELAGLFIKKVIDEPTAAAIAFGMTGLQGPETLMVFDLGGGTFDISLMHAAPSRRTGNPQIEVFEIHGDSWLGGSDMDERLYKEVVNWFRDKYKIDPEDQPTFRANVRQEVERIKIELSQREEVPCVLPGVYEHPEGPKDIRLEITRARYAELIQPELGRIMDVVNQALEQSFRTANDITQVLLVGGASQTPAVRERLEELFGIDKMCADVNPVTGKEVNPMTIVAEGAATYAAHMQGIECPNVECGETQEVIDRKSGNPVSALIRTVNEESETHCKVCEISLAAGRAQMASLSVTDKTASVLGIIAVRGSEHNAFVPLIEKGTIYPLKRPAVHRFHPYADRTRQITLAVFESLDNLGNGRFEQGRLDFALDREITRRDEVIVSFNLDRNREVTLEVTVPSKQLGPFTERLKVDKKQVAQSHSPPAAETWDEQLDNLVRHLQVMQKSYGDYAEPVGLQREKIDHDLKDAAAALSDAGDGEPPRVKRLLGTLEMDLRQSGPASDLYFADIMHHNSDDSRCKSDIVSAKQEFIAALKSRQPERIQVASEKLRSAVARSVPAGSESKHEDVPIDILNIPPEDLLSAD